MKRIWTFFFLMMSVSNVYAEHVRVGLPIEVNEMDPVDLSYVEEFEVFASVHDTLLNYQSMAGLSPVLADKWEFDKDKKTITFYLKSGLKFSDGTPLTAKDVEYTFKRLILLDKEESLTLTQCLSPKNNKVTSLDKPHSLIKPTSATTIVLGPTVCGEALMKRFGDPNYGIISKSYIGKDLKLLPGAATSGAFIFKKSNEGFSLIPNKNNWRWGKMKDKDLVFDFVKIDQDYKSIEKNKIDIFRTSRQEILNDARKDGFNEIISVPNMIWFITGDPQKLKATTPYFKLLNSKISTRKNYQVFNNNVLESPADNFFPGEFNCSPEVKPVVEAPIMKKGIVRIHNHKNGESKIFINDLKKDLESSGIKVLVDKEKNPTKETPINLYIERQFFDDAIRSTLDYSYRIFKSIPDPKKIIVKPLEQMEQKNLTKKEEAAIVKIICANQYLYNHAPLSHRKYAFVFKSERFKPIFFKGSGNLIYNEILK